MMLETALRDYLARQLQVIEAEEAGIAGDGDPESLHRFRVALRRSRAVLGELEAELVPALAGLRPRMADVMRRTNACRDADVFLAHLPAWQARLPDCLADGITGLARPLRRQRAAARQAVLAMLAGEDYRTLKADWHAWLAAPPGTWLRRETPVTGLRRHLERRRRKVRKRLRALGDDPTPEAVHRLRIAVKKRRYLLEFAASAGMETASALARLKRLQALLGDYHDAAVQFAWLARLLATERRLPRDTAAVVGWLLAERQRRQTRLLRRLAKHPRLR